MTDTKELERRAEEIDGIVRQEYANIVHKYKRDYCGLNVDEVREVVANIMPSPAASPAPRRMTEELHIVFDGPPSHDAGRFVEVETADGKSVNAGKWEQRGEYWHLIIQRTASPAVRKLNESPAPQSGEEENENTERWIQGYDAGYEAARAAMMDATAITPPHPDPDVPLPTASRRLMDRELFRICAEVVEEANGARLEGKYLNIEMEVARRVRQFYESPASRREKGSVGQTAADAIDLFIEYRDKHDCVEDVARSKAINEINEGKFFEDEMRGAGELSPSPRRMTDEDVEGEIDVAEGNALTGNADHTFPYTNPYQYARKVAQLVANAVRDIYENPELLKEGT